MLPKSLSNLWYQAWSLVLVEMSPQEVGWLLRARDHISLLSTRRTTMIVSRVRLVAGLFAILTPLWIIIDVLAFPPQVWVGLVVARLAATGAFLSILVAVRRSHRLLDAYRALAMLLAIPTAFYLFTYQHMAQFEMHGIQAAFATGYAFLPFVMMAGLSVFPLTLFENIGFAAPMLAMQVVATVLRLPVLDWGPFAASLWLLMLITAVAALAGVSQLAFMIVLVREAIRDGLTGCFSRQSGEELLELQFIIADRSETPLALAFVDLDHFKQINDQYGHDAGDRVLIDAVDHIRDNLRVGDMLVRWGGEEFLVIMPNANALRACTALTRLQGAGLGSRPDGTPLTASIGVAERQADRADNWRQLVEAADGRMYRAKEAGRNRLIGCDNQPPPL